MKGFITFIIISMALASCTVPPPLPAPVAAAPAVPAASMPNPASVHCIENGNRHEIRIADDGSQSGICVFSDNSACDEWAYFRGECGPAAPASPTPALAVEATAEPGGVSVVEASGGYMPPGSAEEMADWWGVIGSTEPGAQYDDYFERQDLGQVIYFGIDSLDAAVASQIVALRDSGKIVHLFGTLLSNVPDYNGSQVQVDRIEVEVQASGGYMPPGSAEAIADWWGVIRSTAPGAQFDDYFERQDLGQVIYFGIDSLDPAVRSQIEAFRDSGRIVHLYGTLLSNVPDYNGSQVQVDRIEVETQASGGYMPPGSAEEMADWWGVIGSTEPGAQFDDYFERQDLGQVIYFGIDSLDPAVESQIVAFRDSGKIVHLFGTLLSNVPDYNGSQVQVDRIWVEEPASGGYMPPGAAEEMTDWWGVIGSAAPGAQFDDYFERQDLGQVIYFGIDSLDPAVRSQIVAFRDSGRIVHLYGMLLSNVPDYNGSQVQVDRIEVEE